MTPCLLLRWCGLILEHSKHTSAHEPSHPFIQIHNSYFFCLHIQYALMKVKWKACSSVFFPCLKHSFRSLLLPHKLIDPSTTQKLICLREVIPCLWCVKNVSWHALWKTTLSCLTLRSVSSLCVVLNKLTLKWTCPSLCWQTFTLCVTVWSVATVCYCSLIHIEAFWTLSFFLGKWFK